MFKVEISRKKSRDQTLESARLSKKNPPKEGGAYLEGRGEGKLRPLS
jgi:hypothetical protein